MGGFPALPSGNNPYASEAAGYAHAAATVYDRLQSRLATAAHQHALALQKQQEDDVTARNKDFTDVMGAIEHGGIQKNLPRQGDSAAFPDRPTLQQSLSNPAVPENGKGQTVTTPLGTQIYMPTEQEQGKSFVPTGGLAGALQGAGWDGKTPITPEHSHAILQALELAQPKDEPYDIDTSGKFIDAQGNPMPVAIGRKTQIVKALRMGGAQQPQQPQQPAVSGSPGGPFAAPTQPAQAPAATPATAKGGMSFKLPEKPEPTDSQQIVPGKKGAGGGMIVFDKKTKKNTEVPYPEGTSDELTPGQKQQGREFDIRQREVNVHAADAAEARQNRRADLQQTFENRAAQDHEKAGTKKQAMQQMAQGFYDAAGVQPGETYFPPRFVNGIVVPGPAAIMPGDKDQAAARAAELKKTAAGFEKTAKIHQNEQERIEKQHGWGKFAAPQTAGQPPAQQPTQSSAAEPGVGQTPAPARQTPQVPKAPKAGAVQSGYRFKGGDPAQQANWEKVP